MTTLQLLLGLVFLIGVLFLAERFTRPPLSEWEQMLAAMTESAQTFAVLLGTQLVPAFEQATAALDDFYRVWTDPAQ